MHLSTLSMKERAFNNLHVVMVGNLVNVLCIHINAIQQIIYSRFFQNGLRVNERKSSYTFGLRKP